MKKIGVYRAALATGIAALLASVSLISCNAPTSGLFYSLENEVPIKKVDGGLPQDSALNGLVVYNDMLLTHGGIVYATKNRASIGKWKPVRAPADNLLCVNILSARNGALNSRLFAIFAANATPKKESSTALYVADSFSFDSSADTQKPTWHKISLPSGEIPDNIFAMPSANKVLLQTRNYGSHGGSTTGGGAGYSLFVLDQTAEDGSATLITPDPSDNPQLPFVAGDSIGNTGWLVKLNAVYEISDLTLSPPALTIGGQPSGSNFTSVFADPPSSPVDLYVGSSDGIIHKWNGTTWQNGQTQKLNGAPLTFSTIARIDLDDLHSSNPQPNFSHLLAGTLGQGVYYLNSDLSAKRLDSGLAEGDPNYYFSSKLYEPGYVSGLYSFKLSGGNNVLFATTLQFGLYLGQFDSSKSRTGIFLIQD